MKIKANLELITPCFCAGADRLKAEIRSPSLRGELRWWFRCLGGVKREEDQIFGSVAGGGNASLLQIRVLNVIRGAQVYSPTHAKLEDPGSYLHFYLDQPPKDGESRMWEIVPDRINGKKGTPRPDSCLPAGSQFTVQFTVFRRLPIELDRKLQIAVEAFLRFGSIGFRHTRGFGSWIWKDSLISISEMQTVAGTLKKMSPGFDFWFAPSAPNNPQGLLNQIETKLKGIRKPNSKDTPAIPAKLMTSLGHSGEFGRQTSAIRFRPVQIQTKKGDTQYKLVIFQAPDQVLSSNVVEPKRIVPNFIPL